MGYIKCSKSFEEVLRGVKAMIGKIILILLDIYRQSHRINY